MAHASAFATQPVADLLPTVPPTTARAARLLRDRRLAWLWDAIDGGRGLSLASVSGAGRRQAYGLTLDSDAGSFSLALLVRDDAAVAMVAAARLEPSLRSLVLSGLFGETADRSAALVLTGLCVTALRPLDVGALPADDWCALRRDGLEICRIAVLQLPDSVEDALRAARRRVAGVPAWRTQLRLQSAAVVGERKLSIATLRSLETGDVLLLPLDAATLEGAPANLRIGPAGARNLCAAARILGDSVALTGALRMTEFASAPAPERAAVAGTLDELELLVLFELETVAIPLGDLEGIEPGYLIELGMPAAQARVRLVSCGAVIGEADLVGVGGRLGARITTLVPRNDADQQRG